MTINLSICKKICINKFIGINEVQETTISLHKAAQEFSNLRGQGYDRYECVQYCKKK